MIAELIKEKIENLVGFKLDEKSRKRDLVDARSVYYKILLDECSMTLEAIGETLSKNHATVLHGINQVFPTLEIYNPKIFDVYVQLSRSTNRVIKTKKRIERLTAQQINLVNIYIDNLENE